MSLYLGTTPIANTGYDKANINLSNLTSTGKNIANWSNNVTNCITEIPQDIKLELNNGTLTLKAGSKVYVPNGFESDGTTPKFDVVTIENDISRSGFGTDTGTARYIIPVYNATNHIITGLSWSSQTASSGTTPPANGNFYNTSTNYIYNYINSSISDQRSFPLGLMTLDGGTPMSIDQVFNGFGYIGSTVFALPNVKGLIPNGRNADGTLKSTEFTLNGVKIWNTVSTNLRSKILYDLSADDLLCPNEATFLTRRIYNEKENIWLLDGTRANYCELGSFVADSISPYKITSLTPKTAFHALDWNDSSTIVGWGMPDYSAGVSKSSGVQYTAETSGLLLIRINNFVGSYGTITIDGVTINLDGTEGGSSNYTSAVWGTCPLYIGKGSVYTVSSVPTGRPSTIIFYPLKGVN